MGTIKSAVSVGFDEGDEKRMNDLPSTPSLSGQWQIRSDQRGEAGGMGNWACSAVCERTKGVEGGGRERRQRA